MPEDYDLIMLYITQVNNEDRMHELRYLTSQHKDVIIASDIYLKNRNSSKIKGRKTRIWPSKVPRNTELDKRRSRQGNRADERRMGMKDGKILARYQCYHLLQL